MLYSVKTIEVQQIAKLQLCFPGRQGCHCHSPAANGVGGQVMSCKCARKANAISTLSSYGQNGAKAIIAAFKTTPASERMKARDAENFPRRSTFPGAFSANNGSSETDSRSELLTVSLGIFGPSLPGVVLQDSGAAAKRSLERPSQSIPAGRHS